MAEALSARGLDVSLYEMLPNVLQPFGGRSRTWSRTTSETRGVDLHLDTAVAGFAGEGRVDEVHLDGGDSPPQTSQSSVSA